MPHADPSLPAVSFDLATLRRGYAQGTLTVAAVVDAVLARIAAAQDDAIWIARRDDGALRAEAAALDARRAADPSLIERLPLYGIPFAVKDNIDVEGLPTTAGCPAFAYTPVASAPAVARLVEAGAIVIGKTNLDQFATGLVGVRSPYGVPRNAIDPRYVPGGSSSGSAVAVARGLVGFSLGTDTAGSGRVPASFNNIVGLKPTKGIISTRGVVPACRSLDCVSIFALTAEDAAAVLDVAAIYDEAEPFARARPSPAGEPDWAGRVFRFGVPAAADLAFFGDTEAPQLFADAVETLTALGGVPVTLPFAPFRATAELLYSGPWVAERMAAIEPLYRGNPEAILPVIRTIVGGADRYDAVATFRAMYRLAELRRAADAVWRDIDVMLLPTAGTVYTVADLAADPIQLNTNLGYYTNFVNLLDLAGIAVPAGFRADGMPFGVTFLAPAFADAELATLAAAWQARSGLPLGATGMALPPSAPASTRPAPPPRSIPVAVAGAHLSGMPLNHRLLDLGCRLLATTATAPEYRMYLIEGGLDRPGLLRVPKGGAALEVEVWSMSPAALGTLMAEIAPPLAIGTVRLADGSEIRGFLCEADATANARDISDFGSWRRFLAGR
jgi:allophanate hydrolase